MFYPKHFDAQILVVVWDNLRFSLWLCCFAVFFVVPVSNLKLILCVCTVGICSTSPLVPVLQTEPAGQLLLEPTLQLQHVSARVPAPAVLLDGSPWRAGGSLYCFTSPTVQLTQMWCDISFETSYKAQKRQFRNVVKDNHIPIESSSHQAHPPDCLTPA